MKSYLFSLLILLLTTALSAQSLDNLQDPPGIKWKTINTAHYKFIFPQEITPDAQRAANLAEHLYPAEIKTMAYPFKKLTILLSNRSAIANGFVTLAPRRSEWYAVPFQLGSDDGGWYELLAVHELRHAAQFDMLNYHGLNSIWKFLGGEMFVSAFNSLLIPRWFWEGDAVLTETLLSSGGRGRKADFKMGIRTLQLNGQRYSYYKSVLGSYKDFIPNPYPLGYLMAAYARKHYGPQVWSDILRRSSWWSFFPFAFTLASHNISGRFTADMYDDTMKDFRELWQAQQDSLQHTPCRILSTKPNRYTSFLFPQAATDGTIYALKTGIENVPALVEIDTLGKETASVPISPMYKISVGGGFAAWDSYRADLRWGKQSYSDLRVFNLKTGCIKTITHNKRFFAPALSADGKLIAATTFSRKRESCLVVLSRENGVLLQQVPNPRNRIIKAPAWSADGKRIVFTAQSAAGKSLCIYQRSSNRVDTLLSNTHLGIRGSVFYKNYVLFSSGLSGIDNIYAVDTLSTQIYRVTSRPFGAFEPSIIPGTDDLLFSDYSSAGQQIARMKLNPAHWQKVETCRDSGLHYLKGMEKQEQDGSILEPHQIPKKQYPVNDYNTAAWMNVHSWLLYSDPLNRGIYFISNNILNTVGTGAGLFYNRNESTLGYKLDVSYGGFFPIIDAQAQRLFRALTIHNGTQTKTLSWHETSTALGLRLPLNFSAGNYQRWLTLSASARAVHFGGNDLRYFSNVTEGSRFFSLRYTMLFANLRRSAKMDIRRRWGQTAAGVYEHTPFKGDFSSRHLFSRFHIYLPGVERHQSLLLNTAYEWQDAVNYHFQSLLEYPRGYRYRYSASFLKSGIDYTLPLFYPDWSLGGWFYLKRIWMNVFYDYGLNLQDGKANPVRSAGGEIWLDQHWFSLPLEIEGGLRYSFRQEDKKAGYEIIFRLPLR